MQVPPMHDCPVQRNPGPQSTHRPSLAPQQPAYVAGLHVAPLPTHAPPPLPVCAAHDSFEAVHAAQARPCDPHASGAVGVVHRGEAHVAEGEAVGAGLTSEAAGLLGLAREARVVRGEGGVGDGHVGGGGDDAAVGRGLEGLSAAGGEGGETREGRARQQGDEHRASAACGPRTPPRTLPTSIA
jgi:hypothetical protein